MEGSNIITVSINKEEVLKEVARRAYTFGEIKTDDERLRWLLQGVTDMGKGEHLMNCISNIIENIEYACEPYISECSEITSSIVGNIDIVFSMPKNAKLSSRFKSRAERLIRGSLIEGCVGAWKGIMLEDGSAEVAASNKMIWDLKVLVNTRIGVQGVRG